MARQATVSVSNTASKGLITEATGLNFPEDAWTDANNVVPDNKGKTSRRLGVNYESGATEIGVVRDSSVIASGLWTSVGGNGDTTFVIVQVGSILYFFEETDDASLSAGYKSFQVNLEDFQTSGSPDVSFTPCDFASGKGYLFVTHRYCNPFFVSYDSDLDTISSTSITIKVRDFEGVDDGLDPGEHPTPLSDEHEYNLCNQGWDQVVRLLSGADGQPIDYFFTTRSNYPANSDQWWIMKNSSEEFDPALVVKQSIGNSLVPKGHYILDWFNTNRSDAASRIGSVLERSASYYRPTTCAFFAGRVFYSGLNYQNYVGEIYFSPIIETNDQFGQCYQAQDPTSEILSDLLATDGGVIRILDCGAIYKIFSTAKGILVFAANGIWSISGTDTTPFKATDYSVIKVSGIKTSNVSSFVEVQGLPVWWSQEGIFLVSSNEIGSFKVDSLTDTTIKTLYNNIPQNSKDHARGVYNPTTKIITWVYNSNGNASGNTIYNFDRVLNLNTLTGAFYTYTIDNSEGVVINGVLTSKSNSLDSTGMFEAVVDNSGNAVVDNSAAAVTIFTITVEEVVVDNLGAVVFDSLGEEVTVAVTTGQFSNFMTKYIITRPAGTSVTDYTLSFAEEYDSLNRDWETIGAGVAYSSYFIAGYRIKGDAQRFGQSNYIVVYCNELTDGSAFLQVIWDYGKVTGVTNQLYRSAGGSVMQQTKIMLRGRGRVAQFKVTSDGDAPFEVIGWSVFETENSTV